VKSTSLVIQKEILSVYNSRYSPDVTWMKPYIVETRACPTNGALVRIEYYTVPNLERVFWLVVDRSIPLSVRADWAGGRCCDFVFVLRGHGWSITSGELSVEYSGGARNQNQIHN